MPKRSSKQKDTQELARHVLDAVAPDAEPPKVAEPEEQKNQAAVALGRNQASPESGFSLFQ
jgi:hypothetical protein